MTAAENLATIHALFDALNRLNTAALDELCTTDFMLHFPGTPGPLPRDAAKGLFGAFFAAFPDIQHTLDDELADGDKVAVRLTVAGTQTAEFQGMPASGKRMSIGSLNMFRCVDGKVAEQWVQTDTLGMLQQLGAMPAAAAAHAAN